MFWLENVNAFNRFITIILRFSFKGNDNFYLFEINTVNVMACKCQACRKGDKI